MKNQLLSLLLPLVVFGSSASAESVESYFLSKEGLKQLESKNFQSSLGTWVKALESDPLNPKLHLNLGISLYALGEFEKAAKAFHGVRGLAKNNEELFVSLFDEAVALGQDKKVDEALKVYQEALKIHPDSKEVKINIELLTMEQSQQGGKGSSDQKDQNSQNKDNKEGEGEGNGDKDKQKPQDSKGQDQKQKKPQPKKFKSEELTASDVKKILDELKSQEQGIRAKEYEKGPKERPAGKDW
ncbi:MAG: hypothetical protein CL676_05365 [Bdellovibrionaceae bacterium]|nr:hypothetical protein [Pseudobdellovibrionaceae bacterium]|tara:strand:+ start:547 stop:1272 length:726 start_codon:yes stop_codon:yes gene_type:complete